MPVVPVWLTRRSRRIVQVEAAYRYREVRHIGKSPQMLVLHPLLFALNPSLILGISPAVWAMLAASTRERAWSLARTAVT